MRFRPLVVAALLALAALGPRPAAADDSFGLRVGAYTDAESAFLGAEYLYRLDQRLYLAPNLEWVFVENGTYFSLNADLHYRFRTRGSVAAWAGGGLGLFFRDPEGPGRDTDVGVGLLGGFGLKTGLEPYLQGKLILKGDTEFAIGFGIRF